MRHLAKHFLTQEEQDRVTKAVQEAELQTSGEIVPMIVSSSYDYPKAKFIAALFFSLPLTYIIAHVLSIYLWFDPKNIHFFFFLLLPLFFLFHQLVSTYPLLAKLFISTAELTAEVEEEAIKSFFAEKLYKTKNENGILLFISVFEKKAWILADYGIETKIEQSVWQNIIDELTAEIAKNNHCEALCAAIENIGGILKEHFPYHRDDTDELHNLIIK